MERRRGMPVDLLFVVSIAAAGSSCYPTLLAWYRGAYSIVPPLSGPPLSPCPDPLGFENFSRMALRQNSSTGSSVNVVSVFTDKPTPKLESPFTVTQAADFEEHGME